MSREEREGPRRKRKKFLAPWWQKFSWSTGEIPLMTNWYEHSHQG